MTNEHEILFLIFSCKLFTVIKKIMFYLEKPAISHLMEKNKVTYLQITIPFTALYYHLLFKFIGGEGGGGKGRDFYFL